MKLIRIYEVIQILGIFIYGTIHYRYNLIHIETITKNLVSLTLMYLISFQNNFNPKTLNAIDLIVEPLKICNHGLPSAYKNSQLFFVFVY